MNPAFVDAIASAVLYEGYILYPYRPSVKNRQRWTFGGLYPRSYSEARGGSDAWTMQTECLLAGDRRTTLDVKVRFLHLLMRTAGELPHPLTALPVDGDPPFRPVESLRVGERLIPTWQEAVEREFTLDGVNVGYLLARPRQRAFAFPARREQEPVPDPGGAIVGVIVREQHAIEGALELAAAPAGDGLFKVTATIRNLTPWEGPDSGDRDDALLRSLVSTHTILAARDGEFASMIDPPGPWREAAAGCRNVGAWPVLVGEDGAKDAILSAPIILYDYPRIAPESPGDLFDATEIDEILTLRILALSDDEKRTMAAVDERARALLDRTESLARDQMWGLHGAVRGLRPLEGGVP